MHLTLNFIVNTYLPGPIFVFTAKFGQKPMDQSKVVLRLRMINNSELKKPCREQRNKNFLICFQSLLVCGVFNSRVQNYLSMTGFPRISSAIRRFLALNLYVLTNTDEMNKPFFKDLYQVQETCGCLACRGFLPYANFISANFITAVF